MSDRGRRRVSEYVAKSLVCVVCGDPVERLSERAARVWGGRFQHRLPVGVGAKSWDHDPQPIPPMKVPT